MVSNRYGLARFIDAATKRAVRQRCGFGCVVCGCAIVQYHHFDPPFANAMSHEASGITLLCGQCHDRAGRGIIDQGLVSGANASPFCLNAGHAKDILFTSTASLPVWFGSSRVCAEAIIKFDDDVVVGLSRPEDSNGPIQLNATLTDQKGSELLRVINNEWRVGAHMYDIQTTRDRLRISDGPRDVVLDMHLAARDELRIERLKMWYRGFAIVAGDGRFTITVPSGQKYTHDGSVYADIGIWMKSSGEALVATNATGGGSGIRIQ